MNPTESPQRAITVKAPFEGQAPADASATVFVFDPRGTLVASAPLKGGQAAISVPESLGSAARIVIGPTPQKSGKPFTLDDLQRLRGYTPALTIDPKASTIEVKPIPQALWKYWRWYLCRIRGKVVKSINGVDYPVCNARVRVCEVEPFWLILQKLPDAQVFQLRDHVLQAISTPSVPIHPPGPGPLAPGSARLPAILQPNPGRASEPGTASTVPITVPHALPAQTAAALRSSSSAMVRNALVANVELLRPYFCLWEWWWWLFHRCEEIGTVMTDGQGNFDLDHWDLDGDDEDLYFSIDYNFGGTWTSVYAPPIPCNIHWDYVCGSDVTIRITDPRVPVCGSDPNLPGKAVALMTIGNNLSPVQIDGTTGLAGGAPFGGSIEPHVAFSRTALIGSGITHYRWSYRRMTMSDGTTPSGVPAGSFTHIAVPVYRHYAVITGSPPLLSFPTELMGPDPAFPGADLFKIQPATGPGDGWYIADARADTASAFFRTDGLDPNPDNAAGIYELKLELFRSNGTVVNFTDEGITPSVATINAPFGSSTVTTAVADAAHVFQVAGKVVAMRWVLRIDNNVCHGNINDVNVTGGALGPCGFYTIPSQNANVAVSFSASHPHDFATFDFDVARGSSGVINALSADAAVNAASGNGYTRSGTTFTRNYAAHTLFNTVDSGPPPNCDRGAFAEFLYVYAMATDGWSRLSYLDGPRGGPSEIGLKAFALTP